MAVSIKSIALAAALVAGLNMYAESPIHVSPEPGEVSELSEFLLKFDGDWSRGSNYNAKFKITGPEGVTIPKLMSYSLGLEGGYMIYFEDDAIVDAPGDYVLTIPAGRFAVNNNDVEETSFEYTISADDPHVYNGHVGVEPREGSYPSIEMWSLTFDGEVEVTDEEAITLVESNGIDVRIYPQAEDNTLYIIPLTDNYKLSEAGVYTLDLPAGCLNIGGKASPHLRYHYTITGEGQLMTYEVIPAPGTYESIDNGFILAFATEETVSVETNSVWLISPNDDIFVAYEASGNHVSVTPQDAEGKPVKLTEKGNYTLIFTMGGIQIGDWKNDEPLVFDYTITGVNSITSVTADAAAEGIFTLSGVRLDCKAADLSTGMYIIDGKKTFIIR